MALHSYVQPRTSFELMDSVHVELTSHARLWDPRDSFESIIRLFRKAADCYAASAVTPLYADLKSVRRRVHGVLLEDDYATYGGGEG